MYWPGYFLVLTRFPSAVLVGLGAGTGYLACRHHVDQGLGYLALGTLLVAMAASALNQVQERETDALMDRTAHRPIPSGGMPVAVAAALALALGAGGLFTLFRTQGWIPALMGLLGLAWYNGLCTPLKRVSPFALVPGAVLGGLPPLLGWVAAGGRPVDPAILALAFLFIIWEVPNLVLLALLHQAGYEQAGLPTLGSRFRKAQVLRLVFLWTCGTVTACALLPAYGTTLSHLLLILLPLAGIVLVARFWRLLEVRLGPRQLHHARRDLNLFLLVVMVQVAADALWLGPGL